MPQVCDSPVMPNVFVISFLSCLCQLHCRLADGTFQPPRREARALLSEIPYHGPVPLAVTEALQAYNAVIAHPPTSAEDLVSEGAFEKERHG